MPPDFLKKGTAWVTATLEKIFANLEETASGAADQNQPGFGGNKSSLTKVLVSAPGLLGDYYFPSELIGGCCPRVVGKEEEIVWNAAAEACDSERVHVIWQAIENRIWYLAVRSAELASHPNTWCPFGALLPGMKDAQPTPVVYTFYSDEAATMMTVMPDGLQIHRGMSSVVRAKAERTARELGDAQIVELIPERILKLTPTPWYSVSLFEERARRILATLAVLGALSLIALAFVIWLLTAMVILSSKANLAAAVERAQEKTTDLLRTAEELRGSPVRDQLSAFSDVNDRLLAVSGFLEVYEIKGGKVRWRAVVPSNVTADRINEMGGKTIETTAAGVAIGNAEEVEFEASKGTKK